jgi:hypothetical protein
MFEGDVVTEPGQTPSAPDVDQPEGGRDDQEGRTPTSPDVDQPDGGRDDDD